MAYDMFEIDTVNPLSAPVFATDCSFPITNLIKFMPPDDVVANLPMMIGNWANDTVSPQIVSESYAVVTSGETADGCNLPVVTSDLTTCDWKAPNMAKIGVQTEALNILDMKDDFCRRRRINPNSLTIFDRNGNFAPGQPFAIDFWSWSARTIINAHAKLFYHSTLVGDSAVVGADGRPRQFDGLYTQLTGGWDNASGSPGNCDSTLNTEAVLDWGALTGMPGGAPPNAKTALGATVTIWGQTFNVDEGLTLPEVLERYWFDKVEHDWTANRGGVTQWEFHAPWGSHACMARAAACIQPCAPSEAIAYINDSDLRDRFARMVGNPKAVTLWPSNRVIPWLQTNLIEDNTIRLGPRTIGGIPTYGMMLDNLDRYFSNLTGVTIDGGYGYPPSMGGLPPMTSPVVRENIEEMALHWDMHKTSPFCFVASILMIAGLLATARHLWLRIDNVTCTNWLEDRSLNITVDAVALDS